MKRPLERLLSPVADIRQNEAASALLMTLLVFLLLAAYYLLKTAREVLILTEGGAAVKSYSSAFQAMLLLFLVPAYGAFASRVSRVPLVTGVTLFFASNLVLFTLAIGAGMRVGILYFIWVGIFSLMVVAQFWAFANDLYTSEQGKRLFPLIGVGASLGAWIGAVRAGALIGSRTPSSLLLTAAVVLVICAAMVPLINRITVKAESQSKPKDEPLGREGGWALIRGDRYLILIAALALLLNVVNTSGEYLFGRYVVEQAHSLVPGTGAAADAERARFIGETYSRLFGNVNLIGFLLQLFVVSRVFKYLGLERSLFIHPLVAATGYLLILRAPSLQLMEALKTADNSLDYSLGNTTRQALWLPTSREAKYKAKQAIDSFMVRAGDVASAGLVFVGEWLSLSVPAFAAIQVVMVAAWLFVVVQLMAASRSRAAAPPIAGVPAAASGSA
jgi:AAA family ATP:ADP antiporter